MDPSSLLEPLIVLSILLDGHWTENTYKTSDPDWKDALRLACRVGATVRFAYKERCDWVSMAHNKSTVVARLN
jgi:hypothetical protein